MKLLSALLAAALIPASAALAASPTAPLMATVHQFIDAFDKGDMKTAAATHVADPSIVDEVAPHAWRGATAFNDWAAALDKDAKTNGDTASKVTLGQVREAKVSGANGYVAVDAVYSFHEHGKAMAENGHFAFALRGGAGGWKIASWAWTGAAPHAVVAKASAKAAPAAAPIAKPKT
jgi:hypothetical protein